jgi:hypothetical protein
MRMSGYWIKVNGADMLVNLGSGECALSLVQSKGDYFILGFSVFRDYYTSFDIAALSVEIAPSN